MSLQNDPAHGVPYLLPQPTEGDPITALELVTGLIVNRNYSVWDYRTAPFNFLGQICLPFSLLWIPVSLLGLLIYNGADRLVSRK